MFRYKLSNIDLCLAANLKAQWHNFLPVRQIMNYHKYSTANADCIPSVNVQLRACYITFTAHRTHCTCTSLFHLAALITARGTTLQSSSKLFRSPTPSPAPTPTPSPKRKSHCHCYYTSNTHNPEMGLTLWHFLLWHLMKTLNVVTCTAPLSLPCRSAGEGNKGQQEEFHPD